MERFIKTGVNATAPNLPTLFNTPPHNETKEIRIKYGKVMRVKITESSNFSPSKPLASSQTMPGINICARQVNISNTVSKTDITLSANSLAASFSVILANMGTKAALKAPSANKLRNILGKRKETKNASESVPAPRRDAIIISRT